MKKLRNCIVLSLLSVSAVGAPAGAKKVPRVFVEGFYGLSSVNPTDLNTARSGFVWNGTAASAGLFERLPYFGGALGVRVFRKLMLSLRYEWQRQVLSTTEVGSGITVADYFVYSPVFLLAELPLTFRRWMFTLGGGAGYALKFEFHQQYSGTLEDITYKANPIVFCGRASLGFNLSAHLGVFAEVLYEKAVATSLAAAQSYSAGVNGSPITAGQTFKNSAGTSDATADLSGLRYGAGLRAMF